MKKYILSIFCTLLSLTALGQAKKPTIMVVPSDNWCIQNGYIQEFDNMGMSISDESMADIKEYSKNNSTRFAEAIPYNNRVNLEIMVKKITIVC